MFEKACKCAATVTQLKTQLENLEKLANDPIPNLINLRNLLHDANYDSVSGNLNELRMEQGQFVDNVIRRLTAIESMQGHLNNKLHEYDLLARRLGIIVTKAETV